MFMAVTMFVAVDIAVVGMVLTVFVVAHKSESALPGLTSRVEALLYKCVN